MTQAPTIAEEQRLIAEDFELFDDWREKIEYVLDLGRNPRSFPRAAPDREQQGQRLPVAGWMVAQLDPARAACRSPRQRCVHRAWPDRLLLRLYANRRPQEILGQPARGVQRDRSRRASVADPGERPARDDQADPPARRRSGPRRGGRRRAVDRAPGSSKRRRTLVHSPHCRSRAEFSWLVGPAGRVNAAKLCTSLELQLEYHAKRACTWEEDHALGHRNLGGRGAGDPRLPVLRQPPRRGSRRAGAAER